ncbi:MAG TPA: hypothetical protein VFA60_07690 [Terriglobales bacterium]|nr:hypothetical protein [Terriglobales bacterium]
MSAAAAVTILLVDGNLRTRNARAIVLGTHGYDVQCATAAEAQRECRSRRPDLLLLGLGPTPASTFVLMAQIRSEHPQLRIALLMDEDQHLCAVSFEGKTILPRQAPEDLVERVARLVK